MAVLAIVIRIVIFLLVGLGGLFCIMATAGNYWINKHFREKVCFTVGCGNLAHLETVHHLRMLTVFISFNYSYYRQ